MMQSPLTLAGSVVVLVGVATAFVSGAVFNAEAAEIIHVGLGVGFLLLAAGSFDFWMLRIANLAAGITLAALGLIFLLQAVAELTDSAAIASVAYGVLGQIVRQREAADDDAPPAAL